MPTTKATPKAGITLFSNDGGLKFVHSPSGAADFSLKHPFGQRVTLGVGFTDNTVRKIRNIPGLILSGDIKVRDDLSLSLAHNLAAQSFKTGVTYDTKIRGKKTQFKVNHVTKGNLITGEVSSVLAPNKRATLAFSDRQVTNVKLALLDGPFTYEPSYNLVRKAPSLSVSRAFDGNRFKFGWNLKTDDLSLELSRGPAKLVALKHPGRATPTLGASLERAFEF